MYICAKEIDLQKLIYVENSNKNEFTINHGIENHIFMKTRPGSLVVLSKLKKKQKNNSKLIEYDCTLISFFMAHAKFLHAPVSTKLDFILMRVHLLN